MQVPEFIKEFVWSFFPPRYYQLADKPFKKSIGYMSKVLLVAFIVAGLLFVPKLFFLKGDIQNELSKFSAFSVSANITQTGPVAVPSHNPWVVVDFNNNLNLTKEIFVIDSKNIQYRFLKPQSISQEQLKNPNENKAKASGFLALILVMMLPGIVLLLYIRTWLKYLVLILIMGSLFFIVAELTKFRLRWKQMLNIASHALTLVIFIEVISAVFTTTYLLPVPKIRFLGVSIYAITTAIYAFLMVVGIVGYHIEASRKK